MTLGQSAPIGIASTAAGGGTLCAGSILTFAVPASNKKSVGDGCPATQSTMSAPVAMAIDRFDNVLASDQTNNLLRIIYHGGTAMANALIAADVQPEAANLIPQKGYIYTIAGGPQVAPKSASVYYCNEAGAGTVALNAEFDGCPGAEAFVEPRGMAFDADGNIFFSNLGNVWSVRILYVGGTAAAKLIKLENPGLAGDPQPGYVYLIAGVGATNKYYGEGVMANTAILNTPRGLWIDANENVLFAEAQSNLIRKVDANTGLITTIVGDTTRCTGVDPNKVCPASPSAGDGALATDPSVNVDWPYGLVFDGNGNMFIADSGQGSNSPGRIRVVYAGGTLPGISNPQVGHIYTYAGGGSATGTGAQKASFQYVYGVAIDARGYLYVDDYLNAASPGSNHIWRVDPVSGDIVNIAGSGAKLAMTSGAYCSGSSGPKAINTRGDGCPGPAAYMSHPQQAPVFDSLGNFYIADRSNNVIRYFNYNNTFPSPTVGSSTTQMLAFTHNLTTIPATTTFTMQSNTGTTEYTDAGGDTCNVTTGPPAVQVCTVNVKFQPSATGLREGSVAIGTGTATIVTEPLTGIGAQSQLTIDPGTVTSLGSGIQPLGVSADELGNVYLSDGTGHRVLSTTIAGGTATPIITGVTKPTATATDAFGDLYVADSASNNIVMRSVTGAITTVLSGLSAPQGLAPDLLGGMYVADTGNNRILLYSPVTGQSSSASVYPLVLNAPKGLAVDARGNLFIVDSGNQRLVELPTESSPVVVALPSGVVPTTVAVDPAGSLYVTDSSSNSLLQISASGNSTTLLSALGTPTGLAIDSRGNLFFADSNLSSVTTFNRSQSSVNLDTTNIGDTSLPATFTLSNTGNVNLTLSTPSYIETGNAAAFPARSPATCNDGLVLIPTSTCTQSFVFQPTTTGTQSALVAFSPTSGGSIPASLSAVGVNIIRTSVTLTQSNPPSGNANYGQTVIYTATMTPQSNGATAPTGTIILSVDGFKAQTIAVSSNPYTFSLPLKVGTHTISVEYSGDSIYAGNNASTSITVDKAVTVTTSSYQQTPTGVVFTATVTPSTSGAVADTGTVSIYVDNAVITTLPVGNGTVTALVLLPDGTHTVYAAYSGDVNYDQGTSAPQTFTLTRTATTTSLTVVISSAGTGITLTAYVKPVSGSGSPTGTVTFTNGTTILGIFPVTAGGAQLTTTTAAYSSTLFSAIYSGDGVYQPSIGNDNGFYGVPPLAAVGVPNGGQITTNVTVIPVNGYSGTLTASCSNLPANMICRFLPALFPLTAGSSSVLQVEFFAGVNPAVASRGPGLFKLLSRMTLALLLFIPGIYMKRRRIGTLSALLLMSVLTLLPLNLAGCGQSLKTPAETNNTYVTPVGTYPVTLTLTDGTLSRSVVINVSVTQ
ncbi:MAG TPA: Ig-like domain repeat protein [Acidobacteriaceae bacterium]